MKKLSAILLLAVAVWLTGCSKPQETEEFHSPKREMRAAWMHTVNFSSFVREARVPTYDGTNEAEREAARQIQKNAMIRYFDAFQAANFNAVFLQVRPNTDAFYRSSYEPWSHFLSEERGQDPGWDPLEFAIEQAHKRGMELHAWLNPYRISFSAAQATAATTPYDYINTHPEWVLVYDANVKTLNPALPEVTQRITDVVADIIRNYNVDGIVLDDYFYADNRVEGFYRGKFHFIDRYWYEAYLRDNPESTRTQADWRRANANKMVRAIFDRIQIENPAVRFGLSPAGVARYGAIALGIDPPDVPASDWQFHDIYSDPIAWMAEGSIDYISPQIYWPTTHEIAPFAPLAKWWSEMAAKFNVHFFPSHAIDRGDPEEIGYQIDINRRYDELGAPGFVAWSGTSIVRRPEHIAYLATHQFRYIALPPAMCWKPAPPQRRVENLRLTGQTLSWTHPNEVVRFVVYAIPRAERRNPNIFNNPRYILGISYAQQFVLPREISDDYLLAVSVLDRFGNEFLPARILR